LGINIYHAILNIVTNEDMIYTNVFGFCFMNENQSVFTHLLCK